MPLTPYTDSHYGKILQMYGIPMKIINIIKSSYRDTTCAVRSEGSLSSWFKIITGVRQGDVCSPLLFGLATDFVMKAAVDHNNRGLTLLPRRSSRYPALKLADRDLDYDITLFEEIDSKMAKTEIMPIGRASTSNPIVSLGNEGNVRVVEHLQARLDAFNCLVTTHLQQHR